MLKVVNGTTTKCGLYITLSAEILLLFNCFNYANKAMTIIVFPNPISSASIPFKLFKNNEYNHSNPANCYGFKFPPSKISGCCLMVIFIVCVNS